VAGLTTRVDTLSEELESQTKKLSDEIERQNIIILGMQKQFQVTMSKFSTKLQAIYESSSVSPLASTSEPGPRGDQGK
jgi:hypothetical protein